MKEEKDIRWKQRFASFEKAFLRFEESVNEFDEFSADIYKEGLIQRFEYTHELSWKVMKDYLEFLGFQEIIRSKSAVRMAFQNELINDGEVWMEMITSRNLTSHTYEDAILEDEFRKIIELYYPYLQVFYEKMKQKL